MDRYEVPIDAHLAPLVEAAERGEEVVIVRDGRAVASVRSEAAGAAVTGVSKPKVIDDAFIARITEMQEYVRSLGIPPCDAAKLVREMRDEGY